MTISLKSVDSASGAARHQLSGRLEFDTAAEALRAVSEAFESTDNLTLDLSGITAVNSAGLALLVECKSIARRSGKSVSFESVPHSVQKIAEVCQVQDLLA